MIHNGKLEFYFWRSPAYDVEYIGFGAAPRERWLNSDAHCDSNFSAL
jgi:hypothetical protein